MRCNQLLPVTAGVQHVKKLLAETPGLPSEMTKNNEGLW
jgi:hypothetical protein